MNKTASNKSFEQNIRKILESKFKGYGRFGGMSGAFVGGGIGGTKGLVDAISADREGEMDGLEKKEKIKEYLKKMIAPGAVGLVAGGGIGAVGGRLLRNATAKHHFKGLSGDFDSMYSGKPSIMKNKEKIIEDAARNYGEVDLIDSIKNKLKFK